MTERGAKREEQLAQNASKARGRADVEYVQYSVP